MELSVDHRAMFQADISTQQQSDPRYDWRRKAGKTVLAWILAAAIIAIWFVFVDHLSASLLTFITVLFMTSFTLYYFFLDKPGTVTQPDEIQHTAQTGLSSSDMKEIPSFAYDRKRHDLNNCSGYDSAGLQCAICIATVNDGNMVRQLLMCKHVFHTNCIDTWLPSHSTCPMCRTDVKTGKFSSDAETLV